ncbi:trypco2 family protein [Salinicola endophyticus]|uniref:trypco2 family protein n=1 Tax=Salinicola endophyticus TaxID=1949083 RepID=UPI000DA11B8D|nr:trypco2 family protein [Salinicola endophyticus]
MKIALGEFIGRVKEELRHAQSDDDPFYELTDVELEVAFAMTREAAGGYQVVVSDADGDASETATHRVRLRLSPLPVVPSGGAKGEGGWTSELQGARERLVGALKQTEAMTAYGGNAPLEEYQEDLRKVLETVDEELRKRTTGPNERTGGQ